MIEDVAISANEEIKLEIIVGMVAFGIAQDAAFATAISTAEEQPFYGVRGQCGEQRLVDQFAGALQTGLQILAAIDGVAGIRTRLFPEGRWRAQ